MGIKTTSDITVNVIQQMGSDAIIAAAAWVSTSAEEGLKRAFENPEDVPGVINYLCKNRHGSPFEHGALTVYVHAPIFVWREWHRHRIGFSYNEESARYHKLEPVFYLPSEDRPMFKVDNWKPGRPKFLTCDEELQRIIGTKTSDEWLEYGPIPYDLRTTTRWDNLISGLKRSYEIAYETYEMNLNMGFDPGLARDCLPVGIYSSCWVTMNPRSIMSFLSLRVHDPEALKVSYPLYEIDVAAQKLEAIFEAYWPLTHAAFIAARRLAP